MLYLYSFFKSFCYLVEKDDDNRDNNVFKLKKANNNMAELKKIEKNIYELPKEGAMNVTARIFASEKLLEKMKEDETLKQIQNVAMLPGIQKYAIALPDSHQGYGFNIGGVAAFDLNEGVISPGGVGLS